MSSNNLIDTERLELLHPKCFLIDCPSATQTHEFKTCLRELADSADAAESLLLGGVVPPRFQEEDTISCGEIQTYAADFD